MCCPATGSPTRPRCRIAPASPPSTGNALRNALHALQIHDRNRNEKCVLKIGVWGMETDEEAETAFRELLQRAIRT